MASSSPGTGRAPHRTAPHRVEVEVEVDPRDRAASQQSLAMRSSAHGTAPCVPEALVAARLRALCRKEYMLMPTI